MEPEILEGKLEALPYPKDEWTWLELFAASFAVALTFYTCMLVLHLFRVLGKTG